MKVTFKINQSVKQLTQSFIFLPYSIFISEALWESYKYVVNSFQNWSSVNNTQNIHLFKNK